MFTQNDLKQALHKLSKGTYNEVKRPQVTKSQTVAVVSGEDEIPPAPEPQTLDQNSVTPQVDKQQDLSAVKDKQIELLKQTLKTLVKKSQKAETNEAFFALQKENDALSEELSQLKRKAANEDLVRYKEAVKKLTLELNTLKIKKNDAEKQDFEELIRLSNECSALKQENNALTERVEQYQKESPTALEYQAQKKQSIRQACETSELEAKLSQASSEKATFLARLHELSQKNNQLTKVKEETRLKLNETENAYSELQDAHKKVEQLYAEKQAQSSGQIQENEQLKQKVEELEALHATLEQEKELHSQEIKVAQACVIERQQKLEQETKKYKTVHEANHVLHKEFEQIQKQKQLIEQHLARRVREASILAKQLDEETAKLERLTDRKMQEIEQNAKLQARLEQLEKNDEEKRCENLQKMMRFEEKIAKLQEKNEALIEENRDKTQELQLMKKVKERLLILEKLYSQFGEIVTSPVHAAPHFLQVRAETQKPPQTLFE